MSIGKLVIVGGGHAAAQLCAALADAGEGAGVELVCDEAELPYQRPPLSKSFLKSLEQTVQLHRPESWYAERGIAVHRGDAAVAIDRERREVALASGRRLGYDTLVLATGTRARRLPSLPDDLDNVAVLRSAADALALRRRLHAAPALTVVGSGYIGLEIAATARQLGLDVEVLESAPRPLARSVSPEIAAHVEAVHRAAGVRLRLGVRVGELEVEGSRLAALQVDGVRQAVGLLVLGIGAVPETALAHQAGLEVDNGIHVDAFMRTSDPTILAIGDCTSFPEPHSGDRLRLESVQNASDQAKTAAATLLGRPMPYNALPWFWSEQGSMRLQMAGTLPPRDGDRGRRNGANSESFSLLHYIGDRFVCIESVNASADHIGARKLLEARRSPPLAMACDPAVPLKSFL